MSSSHEDQAPKRLQDQPDETGVLLRRASQEFAPRRSDPARWQALRERQARHKIAQWVVAVGLALAAVVLAALIGRSPSETVTLTPEILPPDLQSLQRTTHSPAHEASPAAPAPQISRREAAVPRPKSSALTP